MQTRLNECDIPIFDVLITDDKRNAGYNIGDLLNMPFLSHQRQSNPHANTDALNRMNLLANGYPNSILSIYCKNRANVNEPVPCIERIRESTREYIKNNAAELKTMMQLVAKPTTICVHVRSGDRNVELGYISTIERLSKDYETVVLLSGIHLDEYFVNNIGKRQNFAREINSILSQNNNIYIYMNRADVHLSLMMKASNLLVHKGGFSCLGSIVAEGNLFITPTFYHAACDNWIKMVGKTYAYKY